MANKSSFATDAAMIFGENGEGFGIIVETAHYTPVCNNSKTRAQELTGFNGLCCECF